MNLNPHKFTYMYVTLIAWQIFWRTFLIWLVLLIRYFDEEDDEEDNMAYQPAPGSPGEEKKEDSEDEDPLDAFMADIEVRMFSKVSYTSILRWDARYKGHKLNDQVKRLDSVLLQWNTHWILSWDK